MRCHNNTDLLLLISDYLANVFVEKLFKMYLKEAAAEAGFLEKRTYVSKVNQNTIFLFANRHIWKRVIWSD